MLNVYVMEIEVVELSGLQKVLNFNTLCWLTAPRLNVDRKGLFQGVG